MRKFFSSKEHWQEYFELLAFMPTAKYVYILQKDEKKRFRFLLDVSKEDRARFYQKFDVTNKKYSEIYTSKKPQLIYQKDIKNLYITYLYPLVYNGDVLAIASVDIDVKIKQAILKNIEPFKLVFQVFILMVFLIIIMTILQIIYYIKSKRRLFTDPLTGTFNRHYLNAIDSSLNLQNFGLAMLDLDKFKVINDTYGHECGDYVLKEVSFIVKKSLRDQDILIRFGGEEFLLLIYTRNDIEKRLEVCERIRAIIEQHRFVYASQEILVSISIGLNKIPAEAKNFHEAVKIADQQLYISKQNGRNMVSVSQCCPEVDGVNAHHNSFEFVSTALSDNRVRCFFQPIYNDTTKEIVKYESLVRILDIDGSIVAPMQFLPYIEHTNVYFSLTKEILSISFAKALQTNKCISINLNYSDLINKDIEEKIVSELGKNPQLAQQITFEILESNEIENVALFKEKIQKIHVLGASISIDDFGSGYSNFRAILDMEADYLKIDGSLIKNIDKNKQDFLVVKNMILFAHDVNMKTIAEYVHSKEVYEKLVSINVDYMQGYYISPPQKELLEEEKLFA